MITAPLKWHGGKHYLARRIVSMMPRHLNYVEPYFGGGAVLFARDPADPSLWLPPHKGVSEVVNDLNGDLANFWRVLRDGDGFAEFRRLVEATPFSGEEYGAVSNSVWRHEVHRAWAFFVRNRMSLAGRMKGFTGVTKTRVRAGMNNEVSAWLSAVEGLPAVHERLKRVLILPAQTALDVIRKFDAPETLFYLDPPYLHATRATTGEYEHEMSAEDHLQLLELICGCEARVMISGYPSLIYDTMLSWWTRHEIEIANHASGAGTKQRKTEVIWCNF